MFYGKQVQAVPFYGLTISEWERAAPISPHLSRSLEMTREGNEWNHSLHLHLLPFAIKSEAELKFLLLFFGDEELRMWSFFSLITIGHASSVKKGSFFRQDLRKCREHSKNEKLIKAKK